MEIVKEGAFWKQGGQHCVWQTLIDAKLKKTLALANQEEVEDLGIQFSRVGQQLCERKDLPKQPGRRG